MKSYLFPILILLAMFLASLFYYASVLDDHQLKVALTVCTVLWFAGLFIREKYFNRKKS